MLFLERSLCSSWSGFMLFLEQSLDVAMHFVVLIAVIGVGSCVTDVVWEAVGRDIVAGRSSALMCIVEAIVDNLILPARLLGCFNFDLTFRGESDGASLIPRVCIPCHFRGGLLKHSGCLHFFFHGTPRI